MPFLVQVVRGDINQLFGAFKTDFKKICPFSLRSYGGGGGGGGERGGI